MFDRVIIERRNELRLLHELFADCVSGQGRVVLIRGSVASGKTALLRAFSEQLAEREALLLNATGAPAERALRMGAVWQLLRSAPLAPEILDRATRLINTDPLPVDDGEPDGRVMHPTEVRVVYGVSALLLGLAKDHPVVIVVDDVQFVDDASLQVLLYLQRRIGPARMLLALTEWQRPSLPRPLLRAEIVRQPHRDVVLGRLSEAGVLELISWRSDKDTASRLASACYALSGGNPFLIHALIDDYCRKMMDQSPVDLDQPVVGAAFRQAVLDCLQRWGPEFREFASGMAILGERATPDLVAELLALKRPVVSQVLEVLTAAGVVESGRLRHPEIVAILLDSLTSEDAARLHTRAAEILCEHGVEAIEVARHLIAADSAPGSWAVRLLRHAANLSVAEDVGLAVSCLELAIRGSDEERDLVDLRAGLVQIAWRVNPSAAARQLNLLHGALRAGELVWRDAVPMIRHLLWQGDLAAAVQHLREVNASAGPADVRTTSKLRLACEWIYGPLRDRVPEDIRTLLTSTDRTKSSLNPWTRTANLNSAWTRGAHSEVVRSAEHILQSCLGDVMPEVAVSAILALDHADQHERTRFWCDMLADKAVDEGAITWQAVLGCARADIDWRRGDLMTAEAQASTALGLLQTQSWGVLIGLPLSILILVNTAAGRHEAAAEFLARAVPEAMFSTVFGARYLHASGHHSLAAGRTLAALDAFERCGAWMKDWALDVPEPVSWRGDIAQAYLKLGLRKDARELVLEQLNRPGAAIGLRTRGISLRVLAACSDPKDRIPVLGEAIELLERCGDRLELARGLADLSHTHRELGQLDCARLMLRRADQVAKTYHTEVLPRQLHGSLDQQIREQGARDIHTNGTAALSDAERKVAELAAHGHTNREIGRKLYITVSTVEQHLTRVYKKLNVTKRTDLPMSDSGFVSSGNGEEVGPDNDRDN